MKKVRIAQCEKCADQKEFNIRKTTNSYPNNEYA